MPPVFGPLVRVEDALVVLGGRERHRALAVADREQRQLLALEELLEHDLGVPEAAFAEEDVEGGARASRSSAAMITPLPAASTSALRTAGYEAQARWAAASSRSRNTACEAVGTPHSFISCLAYALEPSIRAAAAEGPKAGMPACRELVHQPGDQRRLGPHHDQVHPARAGEADQIVVGEALDAVGGDARVAGRGQHFRRLRAPQQGPDERVLATAAADDEDARRHYSAAMKSSMGIALSVSYRAVPREPSSSDTRATVFSSGASITFTKS